MDKYIKNNETIIKEVLEQMGFSACKILESDHESPDFLVTDKENTYLIEFKIKHDEEGFQQRRENTLKRGEVISILKSIGRNKFISKRIKKGKRQLNIRLTQDVDFKIIWYHAGGCFPEVRFDQLKATLYGSTYISVPGERGLPCLYFTFSEFHRYKDSLDAAILSYAGKGETQFCLNDHSPNYVKIKDTKLFNSFIGAIYDPLMEESKGNVYIADCEIDRRKEAQILKYIQKKYGKEKMIKMEATFLNIGIPYKKAWP